MKQQPAAAASATSCRSTRRVCMHACVNVLSLFATTGLSSWLAMHCSQLGKHTPWPVAAREGRPQRTHAPPPSHKSPAAAPGSDSPHDHRPALALRVASSCIAVKPAPAALRPCACAAGPPPPAAAARSGRRTGRRARGAGGTAPPQSAGLRGEEGGQRKGEGRGVGPRGYNTRGSMAT